MNQFVIKWAHLYICWPEFQLQCKYQHWRISVNFQTQGPNCIAVLLKLVDKRKFKLWLRCSSLMKFGTEMFALYQFTMTWIICNQWKCDRSPVTTLCIGQAASMASLLLTAGAKGERRALPNARVMIHQPSGGASGQASDIAIHAKEILKVCYFCGWIFWFKT